jgi:uncharacterized protein
MFPQGGTVAAAGPLTGQGAAPSWTLYFRAAGADAAAGAVTQAGGTVRAGPGDVAGGRFAPCTGPAGAMFPAWQPGSTPGRGAGNDPGALGWTELATPDVPGAGSFCCGVLGWQTQDRSAGELTCTVIRPAGRRRAGQRPGRDRAAQSAEGRGRYRHRVAALLRGRRLRRRGRRGDGDRGTVVVAASDVPGVGRFAVALDPGRGPVRRDRQRPGLRPPAGLTGHAAQPPPHPWRAADQLTIRAAGSGRAGREGAGPGSQSS